MTKADWIAAKAELDAIETERAALLAPTEERYRAAQEKIELIEEDSPDRVGTCEGCLKVVWEVEPYSYDSENAVTLCEECSPSYQDMLDDPSSFYGDDEEYLTPEQAKAIVDAHVAAGGKLSDKMVRTP